MKIDPFNDGHLTAALSHKALTLIHLVVVAVTAIGAPLLGARTIPITGQAVPELSVFDATVTNFMQANSIKGAALAMMKNGRLVLKRGYGWSDQAQMIPFDPDLRVRIASNSKTFTAAATKLLIERGLITTNTLAVPFTGIQPYNGRWGDSRLGDIQVQHLIAHSGGLDSSQEHFNIWTTLALDQPATSTERVSYIFSRPLQFTPGTASTYSTEAYLLLGRVVEKASGADFTTFVQRHVARTWGIPGVQLHRTEPKLRPADEPWYDPSGRAAGPDLAAFPTTVNVPAPEGAENYYESYDSAGELITSVQGLVTFAQAYLISNRVPGSTPPTAGIPIFMNGDRRRYRHLGKLGAQGGWPAGGRSLTLQNTNGVDLAVFVNREIQEPTFGNFGAELKRLTETITAWPGDNLTCVTLAAGSFTVDEAEGELVIGVRRVGNSQGVVSVAYATADGSAHGATDFTVTVGTLTFADDEITRTINIPINNNALVDGDRTFTLGLSTATSHATLGTATAAITIEDDDAPYMPPTVQILSPQSSIVSPPGTNVMITLSVRAGSQAIRKIEYFAGPTLLGEENNPPYTFTWRKPGTGSYLLTARVTDNRGLAASSSPVLVHVEANTLSGADRGVLREFWTRRPAITLANLTNYLHFPSRPTGWEDLPSLEAPTDWGDYYGSRLRSHLVPPITGAYVFWIAANDRAQLWLSSDEREETKGLIASVNSATAPRQWNNSPTQQSQPVILEAGRRYYVEALHKEGTGPDHLAVGWQLPSGQLERPIAGHRLLKIIDNDRPGSIDQSFHPPAGTTLGGEEIANRIWFYPLVVQPDSKVWVSGSFSMGTPFGGRLSNDGSLDPAFTFTPNPNINEGYASQRAVGMQSDGGVIVFAFPAAFYKLKQDGSFDPRFKSFAPDKDIPWFIYALQAAAVQPDDRIVVAFQGVPGDGRSFMIRLTADGEIDDTFKDPRIDFAVQAINFQTDGKILLLGLSKFVRLFPNGEMDTGFAPSIKSSPSIGCFPCGISPGVKSILAQPDGKLIVGGGFSIENDPSRNNLARLNPDGSLDTTFTRISVPTNEVQTVAVLEEDGKVNLASVVWVGDRGATSSLTRLNSDGSLDPSFQLGTANGAIQQMALQPDGKLLVAGFFNEINGVKRRSLARLNLRPSFKFGPLLQPENGVLRLSLTAEPGQSCVLQTSTNLVDWVSLRTNTASGLILEFEHTLTPPLPHRFYRARLQ